MERPGKKKTTVDTEESNNVGKQADKNGDQLHPLEASSPDVSKEEGEQDADKFRKLFGFSTSDFKSWDSFVHLMCRPTDPAGLAYIRFTYGLLMLVDIFEERGLHNADARWSSTRDCRFPLFDFMQPMPLRTMVLLYLVMFFGTVGIVLGIKYRTSCLMHLLPFWYMVLLEKSRWNNHSYLFGILSFLLLLCDANRYWSLDGLVNSKIRNADVPLWNYTLLRAQVFLVYFVAGLKKLDIDWITGYSMGKLVNHWVFYPFKYVLTDSQVNLLVVHLGGLTIDLFAGYLLFFDKTRLMGVVISSTFHIMNSQMFSIGMFPYAMLGLTPLFFYADWPKAVCRTILRRLRIRTPDHPDGGTQPSESCLYTKEQAKPELTIPSEEINLEAPLKQLTPPSRASFRHHAAAGFTVFFVLWQLFLPHSHFITQGYNGFTQGLYGYSWDMMIHSHNIRFLRVTFRDKDTGEWGYLAPEAWTKTERWADNPHSFKQYAHCMATRLRDHGYHNVELYFDVWKSLNKRFQQRVVNPNVDILSAEWSAFRTTPWMMPLLVDLTDWRPKILEMKEKMTNSTTPYEFVFMADFPGMKLENFVNQGVGNLNISVLKGQVVVEVLPEEESQEQPYNTTVHQGQEAQIPTGVFHNVHTVSEEPSCYMYVYIITEEATFFENLRALDLSLNGSLDNPIPDKFAEDPKVGLYMEVLKEKQKRVPNNPQQNRTLWDQFKQKLNKFLSSHYSQFVRGLKLMKGALLTVYTGRSFEKYLAVMNAEQRNSTNGTDNNQQNPTNGTDNIKRNTTNDNDNAKSEH